MTIPGARRACLVAALAGAGRLAGGQTPGPQPCPVTQTAVQAEAPPEPGVSPTPGYWFISADRKVWAPAPPPGTRPTGVGRYWVRPAGVPLTFTATRLDRAEPPTTGGEAAGYPSGFYFGTVPLTGEGCWRVTARAGSSDVTFVTEVRLSLDVFARRPASQVTWSREIGAIDNGATRLTITAVVIEDAATVTRRLAGARMQLRDDRTTVDLYEEDARLTGTRTSLSRIAGGDVPMLYALGGSYTAQGDALGLRIQSPQHTFSFGAHPAAELARLLLQAGDALRAAPGGAW